MSQQQVKSHIFTFQMQVRALVKDVACVARPVMLLRLRLFNGCGCTSSIHAQRIRHN